MSPRQTHFHDSENPLFPKALFREYLPQACYLRALEADPGHANAWYGLGVEGGGLVDGREYTSMDSWGCIKQGFGNMGFRVS